MIIEVLGKPACVQCDATKRYLSKNQIPYAYTDITQDPAAYERAVATGLMQAPVVFVDGQVLTSGFDPGKLRQVRESFRSVGETQLAAA